MRSTTKLWELIGGKTVADVFGVYDAKGERCIVVRIVVVDGAGESVVQLYAGGAAIEVAQKSIEVVHSKHMVRSK